MNTAQKIIDMLQERWEQAERRLDTIDRTINAAIRDIHKSDNINSIIAAAESLKAIRRERAVTHTQALAYMSLIAAIEKLRKEESNGIH